MNVLLPHGNVLTFIYALLVGTLQDYLTWILLVIFQTVLLLLLFLVWLAPLAQVLPRPQLIFPPKIWFLGIYLNFQQQKSFKNQYL